MKRVIYIVLAIHFTGCAPSSAFTQPSLVVGGAGALIGGGAGWATHYFDDSIIAQRAAALGAGVGAGIGLVAGGLLYESKIEAESKLPPIRTPYLLDRTLRTEIDATFEETHDRTRWGRGETRSYTDRYVVEQSDEPYQGM